MSSLVNNNLLEKVLRFSSDMICLLDQQGHFLYVSEACKTILGYESREMTGRLFTDFAYPGDLESAAGDFQAVIGGSSVTDYRNRFLHRSGQTVFLSWSSTYSEEDQAIFAIARDVTDLQRKNELFMNLVRSGLACGGETAGRPVMTGMGPQPEPPMRRLIHPEEKRAIQTVAQQALKLQNIFESITDAFFLVDKNWRIVFVNSEWERLIEVSRKEAIGRNLWEVFPAEVGKAFYQQYHYAVETGRAVHFEAYFEQSDIWLEVKAFPSEEGLSIYFSQISEKIRLRQELEKLSKVASNTRYGVVIANNQGEIEWANNSFSQITGYQPREIAGKNVVDILFNPSLTPDLYRAICQALDQAGFYIGEVPFFSRQQMELWLNLEITTVHDEAKAVKWYILLITDITMNKLVLEERTNFIKELQRHNQSLEQFSHIVSHNLRAPVANIMGLTAILELPDQQDPNYFVLQGLKTAASNLDSIIRDLNHILAIRGSGQQVREEVVVAEELQEVLLTFQQEIEKYRITIRQDFSQAPVIPTVRSYFKSILFNLVSNAVKFRATDRPALLCVRTERQDQAIVLTVQDNGIGFNVEKEKNKVFGLYKRFHSHIEGKGLGLFLVKTQIEALGGKVRVQSQVGAGSTFKVYFNLSS